MNEAQAQQGKGELELEHARHVAIDEEARRQGPGQREGDLRKAQRYHQPSDAQLGRKSLHQVVDGQGR